MANFSTLWKNHVGRGYVCDRGIFPNQCAMRMGKALEDSGVSLKGKNLKRCSSYSAKFKHHKPGHIRSAQELANVFYRNPTLLGAGVKKLILNGTIDDNLSSFKNKKGMVFIMNGWGTTDHIDLWDGVLMQMKGTYDTIGYRKRGKQVWFWELLT
ncbi:T6SS effector amidase Tae4 family protein [Candidatus Thiosymbion oneisti]|uniref:T6SS effector amidase Tae4 family protein n=1 Tax=Candidatus Thiosymbion oneisti TaxID=589554 RepID=UPI001C4086BC|nr:T6SS effector amidase Tae4 family protein [Candidatus Thiosymbion oneisti]